MSHVISSAHLIRLTEMEVVVLCVAERNQEANDVDESCTGSVWCSHAHVACSRTMLLSFPLRPGVLTPSRWVLAHVLLLVASEKTLGLGLGSWATGQLLVEAHDLLHADSIGGGADSLFCKSAQIQNRHGESSGIAIGSAVGELRS